MHCDPYDYELFEAMDIAQMNPAVAAWAESGHGAAEWQHVVDTYDQIMADRARRYPPGARGDNPQFCNPIVQHRCEVALG